MTRNESRESSVQAAAIDSNESVSGTVSETSRSRRPYQAPRLRHLGSVRELTLGGTMGKLEGGGSFMITM